jgi:hypothetical protein
MGYDESLDECEVVQRLSDNYRQQRKTMNIAKTLELEKTTTINGEFNGSAFTFEAKTNAVTPKFMQQIADVRDRPIEMANGLASVIPSWDITWNEDEFPPSAENLSIVPIDFLSYLMEKITDVLSKSGNAKADDKLAVAARTNA